MHIPFHCTRLLCWLILYIGIVSVKHFYRFTLKYLFCLFRLPLDIKSQYDPALTMNVNLLNMFQHIIGEAIQKWVQHDGGGIFVKFCQTFATRHDILGSIVPMYLLKLCSDVPPMTMKELHHRLKKDFFPLCSSDHEYENDNNKMMKIRLLSFNPQPVKAGSIAQVHRATIIMITKSMMDVHEDTTNVVVDVAIKIKRWNIERTCLQMVETLYALICGLEYITECFTFLPRVVYELELRKRLEALEYPLLQQLDFGREIFHLEMFYEKMKGNTKIIIPRIYKQLSNPTSIITMDWIEGTPLQYVIDKHNFNDARLQKALVGFVMNSMYTWGVFHADLHPGNVLYVPPSNVGGGEGGDNSAKVGIIDFGWMGILNDNDRQIEKHFFLYVIRRQYNEAARCLIRDMYKRIDKKKQKEEKEEEEEEEEEQQKIVMIEKIANSLQATMSGTMFRFHDFCMQLAPLMHKHGYTAKQNFIMVEVALLTMEGCIQYMFPSFNIWPLFEEICTEFGWVSSADNSIASQLDLLFRN